VKKIKTGEYLAKLQARTWLLRALSPSFSSSLANNHVLACNFAKYSRRFKKIHSRLGSKPFLIWLLISPPDLKCVATLPCNLSLMACFAAINVSQGSVVTYARCCGLFNMHLTANLPRKLPVKKNCRPKSGKIWQNYGHESVAQFFWPTLYKGKGDRSICDSHRGISLLSIPGIILARVMLSRLAKHVKDCDILPESQWGISQWSRHNGHDFHSSPAARAVPWTSSATCMQCLWI